MSILTFQVAAPLQSWGEVAVGERRMTCKAPTKSGLIGLAAAALGISRQNFERLEQLHGALEVGVRVDTQADILTDYHTIQVPDTYLTSRVQMRTRYDEVVLNIQEQQRLNTILSYRDYLMDMLFIGAFRVRDGDTELLNTLAEKMVKPEFPIYAGRACCVLSLPLDPKIVDADHLVTALSARDPTQDQHLVDLQVVPRMGFTDTTREVHFYWESSDELNAKHGIVPMEIGYRNDQMLNAKRRSYGQRREFHNWHHVTTE